MNFRIIVIILSFVLVTTGCMNEEENGSENQDIQDITLINSVPKGEIPKKMILGEVTRSISKFQKERDITFNISKMEHNSVEFLQYTIKNNLDFEKYLDFGVEVYDIQIEMLKEKKWVLVSFPNVNYGSIWLDDRHLKSGQESSGGVIVQAKWLGTGKYRIVKRVTISNDEKIDLISDSFNVIKVIK
ncbi:immunoglobulin-like domain-containing protein [Paenibacillus sp. BC26]|uniref:immunoglobulin-like domain-containing protein n=1 Tax=Paenibacillus sp. BC26 TaxID=1881032 RepID=UPI0008E70C8B|nr:immunoglobulin-like domain-containing protein [Paenibacillus sp. BC26]SFS77186.1 hypothetical protein SAMN05428962_2770 [Paenibacillus sp. BC26]